MTLAIHGVQIFNFISSAVFGAAALLYIATAWHYGMRGFERTFCAAKSGSILMLFAMFISLLDMGTTPFTFTRPTDSAIINWGRYIFSVWVFPFAIIIYHQLLHDPCMKLTGKHGTYDDKLVADSDKHANLHMVFKDIMVLAFVIALLASIFAGIGSVSDNWNVRWTCFALYLFFSLLFFALIMNYIAEYGFRYLRGSSKSGNQKRGDVVEISHGFWTERRWYWKEWALYAILFLVWVDFLVALALGPSFSGMISYDYESTMYLIGLWVLILFSWSTMFLVRKAHVKISKSYARV